MCSSAMLGGFAGSVCLWCRAKLCKGEVKKKKKVNTTLFCDKKVKNYCFGGLFHPSQAGEAGIGNCLADMSLWPPIVMWMMTLRDNECMQSCRAAFPLCQGQRLIPTTLNLTCGVVGCGCWLSLQN